MVYCTIVQHCKKFITGDIMAEGIAQDAFSAFPRLSIKLVVFLAVASSSLFAVGDGLCSGCDLNQVCCGDVCIYGSSCYGSYCRYDSDCSSGESCCLNACVNGSSCLGHSCWSESDCSFGEGCCDKKCKDGYDCAGSSCFTDFDCGPLENCCGYTCGYVSCSYDSLVIISSIVGILVFLLLVSLVVLVIYRRKRPRRVLLAHGIPAQAYQTFQDPTPSSYQQGYPYYAPPQYEQSPPSKSSKPPPPYNAEPQGLSGGVNSPQTSYGAMPNP